MPKPILTEVKEASIQLVCVSPLCCVALPYLNVKAMLNLFLFLNMDFFRLFNLFVQISASKNNAFCMSSSLGNSSQERSSPQ